MTCLEITFFYMSLSRFKQTGLLHVKVLDISNVLLVGAYLSDFFYLSTVGFYDVEWAGEPLDKQSTSGYSTLLVVFGYVEK